MAKTLKDFLNERNQLGPMKVKNPDEQKFIDKHVTATIADRNGNGDELFKGSKVKMADRPSHRKGYNPGEDEEVYEEVEQIDELSTATLQSYRKKARAQGNAIVDKMKMGGGDWSKDQKDTKTLRKRAAGAQMSGKTLRKRGESLKTEETEQLDELSPSTMGAYTKKAAADFKARKPKMGYDGQLKKMQNRKVGVDRALKKMYGEEAEQIDEISAATKASYVKKAAGEIDKLYDKSKTDARSAYKYYGRKNTMRKIANEEVEPIDENAKVVAHLQKRYGDNIRKSHVRSAANDFGVGYVALAHAVRKKLGVNRLEEEQVDEKLNMDKASMGDVIKDFQDSNAPQFKGKSDKKRRAMAIAAKLSAERGSRGYTKEERLQAKLNDLSESHKNTMLEVFEKLNDDNQMKFMAACDTPEGVEQMLDFAINHRGEQWQ